MRGVREGVHGGLGERLAEVDAEAAVGVLAVHGGGVRVGSATSRCASSTASPSPSCSSRSSPSILANLVKRALASE